MYIVGSDENTWKFPYMERELLVGAVVQEKLLFSCFAQDAHRFERFTLFPEFAFYSEASAAWQRICRVGAGKIAFCKTELVYSVEQVGFAYAVWSADTYDPRGEREVFMQIVFELNEGYEVDL